MAYFDDFANGSRGDGRDDEDGDWDDDDDSFPEVLSRCVDCGGRSMAELLEEDGLCQVCARRRRSSSFDGGGAGGGETTESYTDGGGSGGFSTFLFQPPSSASLSGWTIDEEEEENYSHNDTSTHDGGGRWEDNLDDLVSLAERSLTSAYGASLGFLSGARSVTSVAKSHQSSTRGGDDDVCGGSPRIGGRSRRRSRSGSSLKADSKAAQLEDKGSGGKYAGESGDGESVDDESTVAESDLAEEESLEESLGFRRREVLSSASYAYRRRRRKRRRGRTRRLCGFLTLIILVVAGVAAAWHRQWLVDVAYPRARVEAKHVADDFLVLVGAAAPKSTAAAAPTFAPSPATVRTTTTTTSTSTHKPTRAPPSARPTVTPTTTLTRKPTSAPSARPTVRPTTKPTTHKPSSAPSENPTTEVPTREPTPKPSIRPATNSPTLVPSGTPTVAPTDLPTSPPTSRPTTYKPTPSPTRPPLPTLAPTRERFVSSAVPDKPTKGYYNYNPDDHTYGPSAWHLLNSTSMYWEPYQSDLNVDLTINACESGKRQSPIDVSLDAISGVSRSSDGRVQLPQAWMDVDGDGDTEEFEDGVCYEHHEIRTSPGKYQLSNSAIRKEIHPDKLRIVYPLSDDLVAATADSAAAADDGSESNPSPGADFPHNWGGRVNLLHIDVRIPSVHKLDGREYPAEYQLWHFHRDRRKAAAISIMVDVHPNDRRNVQFESALAEWQETWDDNFARCERGEESGRRRRLAPSLWDKVTKRVSSLMGGWGRGDASSRFNDRGPGDGGGSNTQRPGPSFLRRRDQQQSDGGVWNPYDTDEIMRSIHFYGYSGSLTEPPCSEFVEWHVMDTPMLISADQLRQLKYLLFRNVDSQCKMTSNHFEGSAVRRPVESVGRRHRVHRCTCRDFLSDEERDRGGVNVTETPRCSKSEEQKELLGSFEQ